MSERNNLLQYKMDSKIGTLYLVSSDIGLRGIYWKKQAISFDIEGKKAQLSILKKAQTQLDKYFQGTLKEFDIALDLIGSPFQLKVWARLQKIPYGQTKSYKDIAIELNDKNACRAVGSANGKNPVSIIVPCHRVINANGALGGYAGGLKIKKILLSLEGSTFRE